VHRIIKFMYIRHITRSEMIRLYFYREIVITLTIGEINHKKFQITEKIC